MLKIIDFILDIPLLFVKKGGLRTLDQICTMAQMEEIKVQSTDLTRAKAGIIS